LIGFSWGQNIHAYPAMSFVYGSKFMINTESIANVAIIDHQRSIKYFLIMSFKVMNINLMLKLINSI